jgi:hypothetical protein
MIDETLIQTAENHLRRKHSPGREQRLLDAGLPADDRPALTRWIRDARDANLIERGGIFFACTVRIANGVDADLPTLKHWGCRVIRVPIEATTYDTGDEGEPLDELHVNVRYASVGTGFMEPGFYPVSNLPVDDDATPEEACRAAEKRVRDALLRREDCFPTRAQAEAAAIEMLRRRAAAASQ